MCALRVIAVGAQRDQNHRRVPAPWRLDMSVPSALRTYEFCIIFCAHARNIQYRMGRLKRAEHTAETKPRKSNLVKKSAPNHRSGLCLLRTGSPDSRGQGLSLCGSATSFEWQSKGSERPAGRRLDAAPRRRIECLPGSPPEQGNGSGSCLRGGSAVYAAGGSESTW